MTQDEIILAQQARIEQLVSALKKTTVALEHRWEVIANRAAPVMECVIDEAHSEGIITLSTPDDLAALRAHDEKLLAPYQWQPIETAPKDGSRILFCIDHGEWGDKVWTGLWANGWIVSYGKSRTDPTHWMPLPSAESIMAL